MQWDSTSSVNSLQEGLALDTHEITELIKMCLDVTVNSGWANICLI